MKIYASRSTDLTDLSRFAGQDVWIRLERDYERDGYYNSGHTWIKIKYLDDYGETYVFNYITEGVTYKSSEARIREFMTHVGRKAVFSIKPCIPLELLSTEELVERLVNQEWLYDVIQHKNDSLPGQPDTEVD